MSHHHHRVDAKTIGRELQTIHAALTFLAQADLLVRLNGVAAANGLSTGYLIGAASNLITEANTTLVALPHGAELAYAGDVAIQEDLASGGVVQATAVGVVDALTAVLRLPPGALFEFPNGVTFLNAAGTSVAIHRDPQVNEQLSVYWNQPLNGSASEIASLPGDFQHYVASGFSPAAAVIATTNDVLANHVA